MSYELLVVDKADYLEVDVALWIPHLKALPPSRRFHEFPPSVVLRIAAAKPFSSATKPTGVPTPRGKTVSVDLTPTHAEIASRTSTLREAVTRELNRLTKWASSSSGAGCCGSRIWRAWRRWFATRVASRDARR